MIRSEQMSNAAAILHEVDTYNELIPARGEISATLLIEFAEPAERDAALRRLVGLEKHLWLRVSAMFRARHSNSTIRQMSPERVSAVQFVRFQVGIDSDAFLKLAQAGQVALVADHPNLGAEARIAGDLAKSLAEDLASEPA